MYSIFVKNLDGFEKMFKDNERLNLAKPLYILRNKSIFDIHKKQNSQQYQNLYRIIQRAKKLKDDEKYHFFGMFLNELYLQYIEVDEASTQVDLQVDDNVLEYQVSLLYQFMFPAYYIQDVYV